MKNMVKLLLFALMGLSLVMAGCDDGDDGDNGSNGASAYEIAGGDAVWGSEQAWLDSLQGTSAATANPVEACVICHDEGKIASVEDVHSTSSTGSIAVTGITVTPTGADLVVKFNVKVNGSNVSFAYDTVGDNYRLKGDDMTRQANAASTVVSNGSGNYTVTIPGGVTANGGVNSRYLFYVRDSAQNALASSERSAGYRALVLFDYPAAVTTIPDVLSGPSCENCHGTFGNGFHRGYPSYGGQTCQVCHDATNTTYPLLPEMIHGIHSSANMPTGKYTVTSRAVPPRTWDFSIAFPSYMNNCSNCHTSSTNLTTVGAELIDYDYCMSCHQNWSGFGHALDGVRDHTAFTAATNCTLCHDGATIPNTAFGMHNGLTTERAGLLWDGVDASVTQGARINHQITGVTRTGDKLAITWGATVDGTAVNPCNTTATTSVPTFVDGYSVLKAFFQGGDLVNADNGNSSPGQPNSTNLDFKATGNTVCVGNVATTTITLTAAEAALTGTGRVALQGKPNIKFAPANLPAGTTIQARAKSPTYDYALATGAAATARRSITDTTLCLGCHKGSLYQHGGNRVDNVELCVMCHNEASSEQNVRVGMGVDASEAYDGKAGQTYGFKSMLHAVHATGETGAPIVIYRTRGIYAFAGSTALLPNWPGTGDQVVYGSDPAFTTPHNFVTAHYPRNLNDCSACHTSSFSAIPDQTKAVATTIDAGAAPYDNQLDDVLEGPAAAACMSCHQSQDSFEQSALKAHAYQNGWYPTTFEDGRQTVIDAAK